MIVHLQRNILFLMLVLLVINIYAGRVLNREVAFHKWNEVERKYLHLGLCFSGVNFIQKSNISYR